MTHLSLPGPGHEWMRNSAERASRDLPCESGSLDPAARALLEQLADEDDGPEVGPPLDEGPPSL